MQAGQWLCEYSKLFILLGDYFAFSSIELAYSLYDKTHGQMAQSSKTLIASPKVNISAKTLTRRSERI